ncbi:ribosome assembly factor SBDS [Candidatus Woesearchaeota archaeon]|nr:ribosome assembly factor SBDS [Candidatus Woesearchaeota archaeon]MBT7367028.1 ribosome assembly factor SBDS [Candidatus Woesearchaeota archaeon]
MDKERVSFNVARLRKGGQNFEVVIEPDLAIAYKTRGKGDLQDVLKGKEIFFDAKKGEFASENLLNEIFNSRDPLVVAEKILQDGEIQLTHEYREKLREEKRKKIMYTIHRNALDPKTKLPHPLTRIENAMEEAKVKIDEFRRAEEQIEEIVKKLRTIIPISIEKVVVKIQVPPQFAHQSFGTIKGYGPMLQTVWGSDGSLVVKTEIPAGIQEELMNKLNNLTHGSVDINIVE